MNQHCTNRFVSLALAGIVMLILCPETKADTLLVKPITGCSISGTPYYCSLQQALDAASDGDTVAVYPVTSSWYAAENHLAIAGTSYVEAVTVTGGITVTGRTSAGADAWTSGTAGALSGGPVLALTNTAYWASRPIMTIAGDDITVRGLHFSSLGFPVRSTALGSSITPTVSHISISYCSFSLGRSSAPTDTAEDSAIGVGNGSTVQYLSASYCAFAGQPTTTCNWFHVSSAGTGGSVSRSVLSDSSVTNARALVDIDGSIRHLRFAGNTFTNSWTTLGSAKYGYIMIDKTGDDGGNGVLQGITITHNTFNNSTGNAPNEFAVLVTSAVTAPDSWEQNLALHANNILQTYDAGGIDYPIVGFESPLNPATSISATCNWWAATSGPRVVSAHDTGAASVSNDVAYEPWVAAAIHGGLYSSLAPDTVTWITDTSNHTALQVKTSSGPAAAILSTEFTGSPTTTALAKGTAYFGLMVKSGLSSIKAVTATFSYDTVTSPTATWFNGAAWVPCTPTSIGTSASVLQIYSMSNTSPLVRTGTLFGFGGDPPPTTSSSSSTSSTSSPSTTTTTSTPISTTTTSTGGGGGATSSTTSAPATSTTTAALSPRLSVFPGTLDFSDNDTVQNLTIANTGTGSLYWEIDRNGAEYTGDSGWIFSVSPASGTVAAAPQSVTLTVNRRGRAPGTYTAGLPVSSNAGTVSVDVTMDVSRMTFPGILLTPRLLLFLAGEATQKECAIRNPFRGDLVWEIQEPVFSDSAAAGWLTVSPPAGYTSTEADRILVEVNREGLDRGMYSATIPVRTNAENKKIAVYMRVPDGPVLTVQPQLLLFAGRQQTVDTFTVSNGPAGSGELAWETGEVTYQVGDGWVVSVEPASGETENSAEVTVTVSREGLQAGMYMADIPVRTKGSEKTVRVVLLVAF